MLTMPSRGEPIDYSLLSNIVSSINDLNKIISNLKAVRVSDSITTIANLSIEAITFDVQKIKQNPKEIQTVTYNFKNKFDKVPVVTANFVNLTKTENAKTVLSIQKVDTTKVIFNIINPDAKINATADYTISMIAIGSSTQVY